MNRRITYAFRLPDGPLGREFASPSAARTWVRDCGLEGVTYEIVSIERVEKVRVLERLTGQHPRLNLS